MAFRAAEFADLCSECRAPTETSCLRCGKPLCDRHAPGPQARCDSCELEFDNSRKPMIIATLVAVTPHPLPTRRRTWTLLGMTALIVSGLSISVSTDVFFALLLAVPMAFLGAVEISRSFGEQVYRHRLSEERMLRRQFLAERKPHLRLSSSASRRSATAVHQAPPRATRALEPARRRSAVLTAAF